LEFQPALLEAPQDHDEQPLPTPSYAEAPAARQSRPPALVVHARIPGQPGDGDDPEDLEGGDGDQNDLFQLDAEAPAEQPVQPGATESEQPELEQPELLPAGKEGVRQLFQALSPAERQLSDNQLAPRLAKQVDLSVGTVRKYLGAIRRETAQAPAGR
jgi:hypothetical protein